MDSSKGQRVSERKKMVDSHILYLAVVLGCAIQDLNPISLTLGYWS